MAELTHFSKTGRARMVDVSEKPPTKREAVARGLILMLPATMKRIKTGNVKKGDVLTVANVAAVTGAKNTPHIIPMCHPIALSGVEVDLKPVKSPKKGRAALSVTVTARCSGPTGVEMEALTAVTSALLTVYDMCKAVDRGMTITGIELLEKSGGRSGLWKRKAAKK